MPTSSHVCELDTDAILANDEIETIWRFATPDGFYLSDHGATAIQRHVKVKGRASSFDGNLLY